METSQAPHSIDRRQAIKRTLAMLGVVATSSSIANCLASDRNKETVGSRWKPLYLNPQHIAALEAATELILPRSDTPGAIDVSVPQLIDTLYGKYLEDKDKELLASGLSRLDKAGFDTQSTEEQAASMTQLATSESKEEKAFLKLLRKWTITGYFTSEEVMKNVIHYQPIPGSYRGCVPISEIGNGVMSNS